MRNRESNGKEIIACKKNYSFDWTQEYGAYEVCKLFTEENPNIIQALFSYEVREDFIHLSKIERANFRSVKIYASIVETVVAFICRKSFESGFEGYVSFEAKSRLIPYYTQILGAIQIGESQRMYINTASALSLVNLVYEEG